jgi:GTP cyclohydrolase I
VAAILQALGEDIHREGLRDTPKRSAKALAFLTSGYSQSPEQIVGHALFPEKNRGLVLVRDVEFYSLCEHHLLPFFGKATVAYIPDGKVVGLSKIPRLVNAFARRLQVQERLTREIGEALASVLGTADVAVFLEASHLCMMMRGVEKQGGTTATSFVSGTFSHNPQLRQELFTLLGRGSNR